MYNLCFAYAFIHTLLLISYKTFRFVYESVECFGLYIGLVDHFSASFQFVIKKNYYLKC